MPPRVAAWLPWIGAGWGLLRAPAAFLAGTRARLGNTFLVDAFGHRLFCVFSPAGVRGLYALPEDVASKGLADLELLRLKVPDELLRGRRLRPHELFAGGDVEGYLDDVGEAVGQQVEELGDAGIFDVFAMAHRLGQRIGLACWAGRAAVSARYFERFLPLLDRLDASDAFVRPTSAFVVWATAKRRERAALAGIEPIVRALLAERAAAPPCDDFFARIAAAWTDCPDGERIAGIARDLVMLHMGSQSNLPAALGWTLVDLLGHPALLDRVRAGDDDLLERCAHESIRLAQRSITLRAVRTATTIDDGERTYTVAPGVLLATMLPVTNAAAPGFERFDPARWEGRRLREPHGLAARELVSTFGHGRHACPAQRFSLSAIRLAVRGLVERFELTPHFSRAAPRRRQLGGVARAAGACAVGYRRRGSVGA